jgi:hypothetical protein
MSKERIYVIGDRGAGVLLVKTNPLRVVEISDAEIEKYSQTSGTDGYARVAASLWQLVSDLRADKGTSNTTKAAGVESLVEAGVQLSEVDFVFATRVEMVSDPHKSIENHEGHKSVDIHKSHKSVKMHKSIETAIESTKSIYDPVSDALRQLLDADGSNLQSAVLKDGPER